MPKSDAIGGFEQLTLLALARLGEEGYGVSAPFCATLDRLYDKRGDGLCVFALANL